MIHLYIALAVCQSVFALFQSERRKKEKKKKEVDSPTFSTIHA